MKIALTTIAAVSMLATSSFAASDSIESHEELDALINNPAVHSVDTLGISESNTVVQENEVAYYCYYAYQYDMWGNYVYRYVCY